MVTFCRLQILMKCTVIHVCNHGGLAEGNIYFSNDLSSMPCDIETVGAETISHE